MTPLLIFLPLLLPLAGAVFCIGSWKQVQTQQRIFGVTAVAMVVAGSVLLYKVTQNGIITSQAGGWTAPVGITFVADYLSALMVLITAIIALAISLFAIDNMDHGRKMFGFYPMAQLLLFGVTGAFLTGDVFNMFVWFEVMLMASFVLITLGGRKQQLEGAIKYVALNFLASAIFLAGVGVLYGTAGTLNMADLAMKLPHIPNRDLAALAAVFFIVCFGIKAAMFPLYFWLPASYHTPPVTITALIAGLITKVGVYSIIRYFTLIFTDDIGFTHTVLLYAAIATMVFGVLGAIVQNEYRKLLSFHIISQIGYMILGLALYTPVAIAGAILFILHNILVKTNLFLIAGATCKINGSYHLKDLGSIYKKFPLLAMLFAISAFSLVGIPPLSGFWGKLMFTQAAIEIESYVAVAAVLGVSMLTLYSMTKIWSEAYLKQANAAHEPNFTQRDFFRRYRGLTASVAVLTILILVLGFYPGPLIGWCNMAAEQLLNKEYYIKAVMAQ